MPRRAYNFVFVCPEVFPFYIILGDVLSASYDIVVFGNVLQLGISIVGHFACS